MRNPKQITRPMPAEEAGALSMSFDMPTRYALITPVRDEEAFIGDMIESIATQAITPSRWIIVDDGSGDRTASIVTDYAKRFPFIELVSLPARSQRLAGGEGAVPFALGRLDPGAYDFLARFDADLIFPPGYIVRILQEFSHDPTLGIAGGTLYVQQKGSMVVESNPEFHVRGAVKMYRSRCFVNIGGLTNQLGWDTIDEVMAWSKGWRTRSITDLQVLHRRPTGHGISGCHVYRQRGHAEYFTWSHPLHVLARSLRIAWTDRSLLEPSCYLLGYFASLLRHGPRIQDRAFIQTRRAQQISRLKSILRLGSKPTRGLPAVSRGLTQSRAESAAQLKH